MIGIFQAIYYLVVGQLVARLKSLILVSVKLWTMRTLRQTAWISRPKGQEPTGMCLVCSFVVVNIF
jgi:hypothetical protein